jgi:hypothetical protein
MGSLPTQDPVQQLVTCLQNTWQHGKRAAEGFLGCAQQHLRTHMQRMNTASVNVPAAPDNLLLNKAAPSPHRAAKAAPFAAATLSSHQAPGSGPVSRTTPAHDSAARKAELGRATWTLLHMMAAQYPERPTRQQQRDAAAFITTLARVYPCGSCGAHFQDILRCVN